MTDDFSGSVYDQTFGSILHYQDLARTLKTIFLEFALGGFVDLACGTGLLLAAAEAEGGFVHLVGIDHDPAQLAVAKTRTSSELLTFDLHDLRKVRNSLQVETPLIHLGFCFLNTLQPDIRVSLLRQIRGILENGVFVFEIQNEFHQNTFFRNWIWYHSVLKNGVEMDSMSSPLFRPATRRLRMRFSTDGKALVSRSQMYRWTLDHCLSQCQQCGFQVIRAQPALYRELDHGVPTHWLVVCRKDLA